MYKINSKVDKPDKTYLFNQIVKMMQRGIKVGNLNYLYNLCAESQQSYLKIIQQRYNIANPNSSAQVIRYLEDLNDPNIVEACAPMGKWSSNKAALQVVESLGYEFGTDIINYRTAKKYADSIKSMMGFAGDSSLIHPEVTMTKTNRISYKNPAIMNIPKELLWDAVVPSKPGSILISADIKNQEPNILINMNDIKSLKPALLNDNGLYETIFEQIPVYGVMNIVFNNSLKAGVISNQELKENGVQPIFYTPRKAPFEGITIKDSDSNSEIELIDIINIVSPLGKIPEYPKEIMVTTKDGAIHSLPITFNADFTKQSTKKKMQQGGIVEVKGIIGDINIKCEGIVRKEFKRAWNAMTYGATKLGVKQMCQHIDGEALYDFFTQIPELHEYRSMCQKLANNGCQTIKTYFGTVLDANEPNIKVLKRVLLDLPIQGTAADILSLLVRHFNDEVETRGIKGQLSIYYTRHDELIIEATKELIDRIGIEGIKNEIKDIVEHQVDDWIPFKVEIKQIQSNNNIASILESDDGDD